MRVAQQVDFAGQTATAAAESVVGRLVRIVFFPPPAAHLAARTTVPSMHHSVSSISTWPRSRSRMACNVPLWFHVSNKSHTVAHGPKAAGKSRQGEPVRKIQRMPSITCRRFRGGRPVRLGSGNTSEIKSHCSSVSRCRSMMNSFSSNCPIMTSAKSTRSASFPTEPSASGVKWPEKRGFCGDCSDITESMGPQDTLVRRETPQNARSEVRCRRHARPWTGPGAFSPCFDPLL